MAVSQSDFYVSKNIVYKIATNITNFSFFRHWNDNENYEYICLIVDTGSAAPTLTGLKTNGFNPFKDRNFFEIKTTVGVDIYIFGNNGSASTGRGHLVLASGISDFLSGARSSAANAILGTTYADDYIAQGNGFSIEYVVTVTDGDTQYDIVFDTTNFTRNYLIAYPTVWQMSAGHAIITLGSCSSYADGTAIAATNRNSNFSVSYPSETIIKYDVTPTGFSAAPTKILVGVESTPQASGGGQVVGRFPIWLTTGIKYIFRVDNQAGANVDLGFGIYWFEI